MDQITISVAEACRASGLGRTTIYELLRAGKITSRKVGERRLIDAASLRRYLVGAGESAP